MYIYMSVCVYICNIQYIQYITIIHSIAGEWSYHFYTTLPLPPAHEHSDNYLQLCILRKCRVFLIVTHAITKLFLDEIYPPLELGFD